MAFLTTDDPTVTDSPRQYLLRGPELGLLFWWWVSSWSHSSDCCTVGGQSYFLLSGEWWEFKDSLFELGIGKFCACNELSSFRIPFHGGMLVSKHFHMSDGAPPWANVSELLLFMVPWWKGNFGTGCSLHCYHFWSFSGRSAPHENWAALDIYPFP